MPRKKYQKIVALAPEVFPCYVLKCFVCREKILGECRCPIEFGRQKNVVYRGTCKTCTKKAAV